MLAESRARIEELVPEDATVLDVGAWGKPLSRADWVIDLQPYETRGLYGYTAADREQERFSADTWVIHDICGSKPWPFSDLEFDFVVCSHTLEDVRDPVRVCAEMVRVGRAGYIEVPARIEEQAYGLQGRWAGWDHHRWLCDVGRGGIEFVHKSHYLHGNRDCTTDATRVRSLPEVERRLTLWWEGAFDYRERLMLSTEDLHDYLSALPGAGERRPLHERIRARLPGIRA